MRCSTNTTLKEPYAFLSETPEIRGILHLLCVNLKTLYEKKSQRNACKMIVIKNSINQKTKESTWASF